MEFSGSTSAHGTLIRAARTADISVQVRARDSPVSPCLAGLVDRREHLANGTVLDIADFGGRGDFEDEAGSEVGRERGVVAYRGDKSRVVASIDTSTGASTDADSLLTVDELIAVATAPGLAVTAPVPDDFGRGGVCERIVASTVDGRGDLEISIGTAVPEPGETFTLPGATTVTRRAGQGGSGDATVRVGHPTGETVVVTQTVARAVSTTASPLTIEQLEFIATTPGLTIWAR